MLNNLTAEEIEGGYRRLCGSLLVSTAYALAEKPRAQCPGRKLRPFLREVQRQREIARDWLEGGGAITFDECCAAVEVAPDRMRADLLTHCQPGTRKGWKIQPPSGRP
jgi:hypothetical protein